MELTNIDRRRLEHAARLIDEVRSVVESLDLQKSTAKLTLAAEKIRVTLAPEIGDEPDEPFRVLGSCPAPTPQVDVIDREVT